TASLKDVGLLLSTCITGSCWVHQCVSSSLTHCTTTQRSFTSTSPPSESPKLSRQVAQVMATTPWG
ncbi:hypothetical protein NPIL_181261, partial [Nephila pilipes]